MCDTEDYISDTEDYLGDIMNDKSFDVFAVFQPASIFKN